MTRREREKKAKEGGRMEIERGGEKRRDMNKGVEKERKEKKKRHPWGSPIWNGMPVEVRDMFWNEILK